MSVFSKYSKWLVSALLILSVVCFALPFSLFTETESAVTGFAHLSGDLYVHFFALTLLSITLGLCAALFERDGRKKYGESMLFSLTGAALSAYLMRLLSETAAHAIGIGLKLNFVLLCSAFAVSALGLFAHKKYAPA